MARIYLSPPHMNPVDRELLLDAFDSNWVAPLGPHVDAFEGEVAAAVGVAHAAALSSGTAALHLALEILGVGAGDEVWVATLTFAATANAVSYTGATPVFIDSETTSWNIDAALVAEELAAAARRARLPKAIIAVDLYGQCADYDALRAACAPHGVPLIEDAAEALGATYRGRPAGSLGDMAVLSFNGNKIITASAGGMLVSQDAGWIARARFLATQARDPAPHYQHSHIGHNYRLSNLLAAVGRGQLQHLHERVAARRANFNDYRARLGDIDGVEFMPLASWGEPNHWLTCLLLDPDKIDATPDDVRRHLAADDIEARPLWKPMHQQPVFSGCRVHGGAVADRLFATGLCLPSGSALTGEQRERVVARVREALAAAPA